MLVFSFISEFRRKREETGEKTADDQRPDNHARLSTSPEKA
jgi:hypothetical protein